MLIVAQFLFTHLVISVKKRCMGVGGGAANPVSLKEGGVLFRSRTPNCS